MAAVQCWQVRGGGRASLLMLGLLAAAAAAAAASLSDYEYEYDTLPRESLAPLTRYGRSVIQHVPAHVPPPPAADTVIQRVPRAAEQPARPARPAQPDEHLQPPARLEGTAQGLQEEQAPQVPAALPDDKLATTTTASSEAGEDMETANFFWGLGPVYPHLYVFRRVPHLVPLHGWSPYHAYQLTHPPSAR